MITPGVSAMGWSLDFLLHYPKIGEEASRIDPMGLGLSAEGPARNSKFGLTEENKESKNKQIQLHLQDNSPKLNIFLYSL